MHVFFSPDISPDQTLYCLSPEESRHCTRVLRLLPGEQIALVDGKGHRFNAVITNSDPKKVAVKISNVIEDLSSRNYFLHLAIAPTKRMERFEWFVEKATEIGVDVITPIITQNSERRFLNIDRLEKKMISALKQSLNSILPTLRPTEQFSSFLVDQHEEQKGIAYCGEEDQRTLSEILSPGGRYLVMVGPEGDFSEAEIKQAISAGYQTVSLGESRLRTETAGLAVCLESSFLNR